MEGFIRGKNLVGHAVSMHIEDTAYTLQYLVPEEGRQVLHRIGAVPQTDLNLVGVIGGPLQRKY